MGFVGRVTSHSLVGPSPFFAVDGAAARCGSHSEGNHLGSVSRYINPRYGPRPLLPPSRACLSQHPPPSVFGPPPLGPSIAHPLQQNRDVEKDVAVHHQNTSRPESEHSDLDVLNLSTKLQNPLAGKDQETLEADAVGFCEKHGLMEHGMW